MAGPVTVVVVDDEAIVREGVSMLLGGQPGIDVVGTAGDGLAAIDLAGRLRPAVVVMDVRMPGGDGIATTRALVADRGGADDVCRVLLLSSYQEDETVKEGLRAGASGFLLKTAAPRHLVEAVREVAAGNAWLDPRVAARLLDELSRRPDRGLPAPEEFARLTNREQEVLTLLARGLGTEEIVAALVISEATAKTHVSRILLKLGLRDRAQAVAAAYRSGFVHPSPP